MMSDDAAVFSNSTVNNSGTDDDAVPLTNGVLSTVHQPHVLLRQRFGGCSSGCLVSLVLAGVASVAVLLALGADINPTSRKFVSPIKCHSPTIDRRSVAAPGTAVIPLGYKLVQATVHQRHLDRWMYVHDYIDNYCWTNQRNSTDQIMQRECTYNLSSVWESATFDSDPYAYPARGYCNPKQLTIQGKNHAEALGEAYRAMFDRKDSLCDGGSIKLESDVAQKNQQSTQHVYKAMCGHLPNPTQYPANEVLDDGTVAPGRPFFLTPGICDSEFFRNAQTKASELFLESDWIPKMRLAAQVLAEATGKQLPRDDDLAEFEDNIEDCAVCHACHGLHDTPSQIWSVFDNVNEQETASRLFPFEMFDASDEGERNRFVANYFGYYFVLLRQRMQWAVDGKDGPMLYLQVTSDDRVSIMLRALRAPTSMVARRPVWGSQIVFQLLEKEQSYHVRMLYNGEELEMKSWESFQEFVKSITPTKDDCSIFYDNVP